MTTTRNETIAAAAAIIEPAVNSLVNQVVTYRPNPSMLRDRLSVSFYAGGPDLNLAGGKRPFFDLIFVAGKLHTNADASLQTAEEHLNDVEDAIIETFKTAASPLWTKSAYLRSFRPPAPTGVKNIRYATVIMRFKVR